MPRTPRKTEKTVDHQDKRTCHGESGKKDDSEVTRPVSMDNKAMAAVEAPVAETTRTRSSARLSNRASSLSVASTREVTRKAKAKGKDTLMRRVFHNPDGSLRGIGTTPQVPSSAQPHSAKDAQALQVENSKPTELSEADKSKKDEWCHKAKGGVTFRNALEVSEKEAVTVNLGVYHGIKISTESLTGGGGRKAGGSQQKLPPVFHFEHPPPTPGSGSTSIGNGMHTDSHITSRAGFTRENAAEVFENGPLPPSYGIYPTNNNIDPELLMQDDECFGRRPPVEDKIWFTQSPFRTAPMFGPNEEASSSTSHNPGVVYFATSNERGSVEVEPVGTTLDVTMEMEKTTGTASKRRRKIHYDESRKSVKLVWGEKGWSLPNEKENGMHPGETGESNVYDGEGTLEESELTELTELTEEEHSRPLSPRFL